MSHLRFSGLPAQEQQDVFLGIIRNSSLLNDVLSRAQQLNLPDWYIVSGALYNLVWNVLTGRPETHGIKDIDLFYYDGADLSYEAEDRIIKAGDEVFSGVPLPVEIRNQARVHLWFEKHFGQTYAPLQSSEEGIARFASKTHAVGIRLKPDGQLKLYAPFGLDDIFSLRITPNPVIDNRITHHQKALRAQKNWPEVTVVPWHEAVASHS
ncbi:nucleotidyltransferase family protein [Pseudochrobactrum sp. sp1633]|uniref:nucleotidyltransferase family protein n=1 Tax=Pseudochrobactrum sp. sp1633 TaxID=3036706 RepID=UPI0025A55435|nr:nucleotidyltransferase family protein [Pseudochrobactrum sp. sp1633]MDM8344936.1 nucleotidyltransferase family protein [Pseudochrobactrum sp. sp1633]HWD14768.1 nucleotidyltransferase family protein [Pseudochrobactrum sp.]